eukprot:SAG11_NODE_33266_length_278_cov_0.849162_1_plen_46_part_10
MLTQVLLFLKYLLALCGLPRRSFHSSTSQTLMPRWRHCRVLVSRLH